jgi:hypothetical protein
LRQRTQDVGQPMVGFGRERGRHGGINEQRSGERNLVP